MTDTIDLFEGFAINKDRYCPACKKTFKMTSPKKIYCSSDCRFGKAQCQTCGKEFQKKNHAMKNCSDCKGVRRNKITVLHQDKNYGAKNCKQCGTLFVKSSSNSSYCEGCKEAKNKKHESPQPLSVTGFYKTADRRPPVFPNNGICPNCEKPTQPIKRKPGQWKMFCSSVCRKRFRRGFNEKNGICVSCESRDAREGIRVCEICANSQAERGHKKRAEASGGKTDGPNDKVEVKENPNAIPCATDEFEDDKSGPWDHFNDRYSLKANQPAIEKAKRLHVMLCVDAIRKIYDTMGAKGGLEQPKKAFTPREKLSMGVPLGRQIKQLQGRL